MIRLRAPAAMIRWPGFYRGCALASSAWILLPIAAPWPLIPWFAGAGRDADGAVIAFFPLALALVIVSLICREETASGRIELAQQSPRPSAATAVEMIAGLWTPFILVAAGLVIIAWALIPISAATLLIAGVVLLILAPLPAVEGWSRFWPLTYALPQLLALGMLRTLGGLPAFITIASLNWYAAVRRFADPQIAIFREPYLTIAAAVTSALTLLTSMPPDQPLLAAAPMMAALVAVSPILVDHRAPGLSRAWWSPAAVFAGITAAASTSISAGGALGLGVAGSMIWMAMSRVRWMLADRPAEQGGIRIAALMLAAWSGDSAALRNLVGATDAVGVVVDAAAVWGVIELLILQVRFAAVRRARARAAA